MSVDLLFQEKKQKIDFQDGHHGGHLGFPIGIILAIFDLQVTPMLPTNFKVSWPFHSGGEVKNRFPIGTISAIFYLQVTLMLPTKFQINLFNGSGGVVENVKS